MTKVSTNCEMMSFSRLPQGCIQALYWNPKGSNYEQQWLAWEALLRVFLTFLENALTHTHGTESPQNQQAALLSGISMPYHLPWLSPIFTSMGLSVPILVSWLLNLSLLPGNWVKHCKRAQCKYRSRSLFYGSLVCRRSSGRKFLGCG